MNITRGLFRIWIVWSLSWIVGTSTLFWMIAPHTHEAPNEALAACEAIVEKLDQKRIDSTIALIDCFLTHPASAPINNSFDDYLHGHEWHVAYLVAGVNAFFPPALVLFTGLGIAWAYIGFRQS